MNKVGLVIITFLLLVGLAFAFYHTPTKAPETTPTDAVTTDRPTDEMAELTAFGFMQDFILTAPPEPDMNAAQKAYDALSSNAKEHVSLNTISRDLAMFVGVQDIPESVSVENLHVNGDKSDLIVGMNYSGSGRSLRKINMVIENGQWKVDSIEEQSYVE